jgi:predicted DNA-binding protein
MKKRYAGMLPFKPTEEQSKKLKELSQIYERPKAYFIRVAIDRFLRNLEENLEDEALYRLAIQRLKDSNDPVLTKEEFEKELENEK